MKASELMIGDWVINTEFGKNKVCQVESVELTRVWLRNCNTYVPCEFIYPIPLKRIHLTKNGFSAANAEDNEFVYRDGYEVKVMIEEDFVDAIFLSIEFAEKNIWKEIKYVHELQQAMRIMDCDKIIKL